MLNKKDHKPKPKDFICYSQKHDGKWFELKYRQDQCPEFVFFSGPCQGVRGHKGQHWCYGLDGNYHWEDNDDDPKSKGYSGSTPSDHPSYVHPKEMADKHYHHVNAEWKEVKNKSLIKKLNSDHYFGKNVTIDRPVPPEEASKLMAYCEKQEKKLAKKREKKRLAKKAAAKAKAKKKK